MPYPKDFNAHRAPAGPWVFDPLEPRILFAAPTVVDVLVVYSADAKSQLQVDDAGVRRLIRQSVDAANQVHYNTGDGVVFRLVGAEQVDYSNGGASIQTDLARLSDPADGHLDDVPALREDYGADLVSLVSTPPGTTAGLATPLDDVARPDRADLAFSVLQASALGPDSFVFAQQTARNLGAGPERGNPADPTPAVPFPYAYGYAFTGDNGVGYGDVMSSRGLTLPYFSNPSLTYQGQPLGKPADDPAAADLYSTFLQTAPVVAGYREPVVIDTIVPTASIYQADRTGDQLTFTVRYADDVAIDAGTLGAGDVFVRTPEGFDLAAALVSVDRPGDGYAKLATYRITLPASDPALGALGFFLNAAQVRDTGGNAAPAAPIPVNADFDVERWQYQLARDTGTLTAPAARRLAGGLSANDVHDYYKFTLTGSTPVSFRLGGLTAPAEIFLMQDVDGNGLFGGGPEQLGGTPNSTDLAERSFSRVLPAGTYYVLVQLNDPGAGVARPATPYALTLRALSDATPPTATLDAVDITTSTSTLSFSVIFSDDQELDFGSIRVNALIGIQGVLNGRTGSPNSVTTLPDGRLVANYSINAGGTIPAGQLNFTIHSLAAVKDSAGNVVPSGTPLGSIRIGATPDTTPPTAAVRHAPIVLVPGGTGYDFTVAYRDNRGLATASLDDADIIVTGPGGFAQPAQLISTTLSPRGALRYATYRVTPPGGAWDHLDYGTYTIVLQPAEVTDVAGNAAPEGPIGTFTVSPPLPGDADGNQITNFDDLLILAANYNNPGNGYRTGDFDFNGVVNYYDLHLLSQYYNQSRPLHAAQAASSTAASHANEASTVSDDALLDDVDLEDERVFTAFSRKVGWHRKLLRR